MVKKNDLPEDVSVLSLQQQEKIVFSIVEQGCARQLIEMVENGYKLTPVIFELLKWSGQKDLIVSLLNVKFDYEGDARWLFAFLKKLLGSKETAKLIVRKYNSAESSKNCWKRLMNLLSPEQMEENGRWDELAKEGCWDVLARNKRFDEIINNPSGRYTSDAARLLVENGQTDRIVELKKFQWFTQIAGGEEILWQHKQFGILFESRDRLRRWTEADISMTGGNIRFCCATTVLNHCNKTMTGIFWQATAAIRPLTGTAGCSINKKRNGKRSKFSFLPPKQNNGSFWLTTVNTGNC